MMPDLRAAEETAKRYFKTSDPLDRLGWGIGGVVFLSPDSRTAVKVYGANHYGFARELHVYKRLRKLGLSQLYGLTIPKLRGFSTEVEAIEMDFVSAPYLLDFAGVLLGPPDFEPDTMDDWRAKTD